VLLEQLHDQRPALIQSSAQRRVGDPVQVPEEILSLRTWWDEENTGSFFNEPLSFCSRSQTGCTPMHWVVLVYTGSY